MRGLFAWLAHNAVLASVVFATSFILPFLLAMYIGSKNDSAEESESAPKVEKVFPGSLLVNDQGVAFRVPDSPEFSPSSEEDLFFVVWFKIRKPLALGERIILVGKYDVNSKMRPGFSFGFTRDADGVRPILYWQPLDIQGKWYPFSPTKIDPKDWNYLAFSFRSSRYLGVHLGRIGKDAKPELLGGYDLEGEALAKSSAPLLIGSFGASKFRGRIGPFGIIKTRDLTSKLSAILFELLNAPGEIPSEVGSNAVKLWVKDGVDLSNFKNKVELIDAKPNQKIDLEG